jgi:hydroxypyruvate isomerase
MGRLPVNPVGYSTISLTLWPEHRAILDAWAQRYECSQSEALRMVLVCAGAPDRPAAKRAAAAVKREQKAMKEKIRQAIKDATS